MFKSFFKIIRLKIMQYIIQMTTAIELTEIEFGNTLPPLPENIIISQVSADTPPPHWCYENRCMIGFYIACAIGFLWVGLNISGTI